MIAAIGQAERTTVGKTPLFPGYTRNVEFCCFTLRSPSQAFAMVTTGAGIACATNRPTSSIVRRKTRVPMAAKSLVSATRNVL